MKDQFVRQGCQRYRVSVNTRYLITQTQARIVFLRHPVCILLPDPSVVKNVTFQFNKTYENTRHT